MALIRTSLHVLSKVSLHALHIVKGRSIAAEEEDRGSTRAVGKKIESIRKAAPRPLEDTQRAEANLHQGLTRQA